MNRHFHIGALALAVVGCAREAQRSPTRPAATHGLAGRVVHADGEAAVGAVVVISDVRKPAPTVELAIVRTDRDGRFTTSATGHYLAVTATDMEQSVFIASVDANHGPIEIRLKSDCAKLSGTIDAVPPIPGGTAIRLGRLSHEQGDTFATEVASGGAFEVCLPVANYLVNPPDGFVVRNAVASLPTSRPFVLRTATRVDAEKLPEPAAEFVPESAAAFAAALPPVVRVLGLGESNHGTREFYDERTLLALALAQRYGFRLLMIEAGYGEVLPLDEYINGGEIDSSAAVARLGYWTWDTRTFLAALTRLREYNAAQPPNLRIHLVGFDIQTTAGVIDYLRREASAGLPAELAAVLPKLVDGQGRQWKSLAAKEQDQLRRILGKVAAEHAPGSASSRINRTAFAAWALLRRLDLLEAADDMRYEDLRNAGMARLAFDVLGLEPDNRAMLWAHLGHLSREYVVGQRTMGDHLAELFGPGYKIYGLLAAAGSARAWDPKGEVGVIVRDLPAAPAYSVEAVLGAHSSHAPVTYWTFARATGAAARWLNGVRALRSFGSVFARGGAEFPYWNLTSFDGAILFDNVTPTEPTATGERVAKPTKK